MDEPGPPEDPKSFIISQKFDNVFNGDNEGWQTGEGREHFDISWRIRILPQSPEFLIDLDCFVDPAYLKWNIEVGIEWKLSTHENQLKSIGRSNYSICSRGTANPSISFDWKSHGDCFLNDSLTVEAHVNIRRTDGFTRKRFRKFDESSMKNVSDVVLVVEEERFWVSKLFLAAQTSFFQFFLLDSPPPENSGTPEFELEDVDANDFQVLLEVLYGELAIDDDTVAALLSLSEKYRAPTVTQQCEHYLCLESDIHLLKQLELSIRYKLDILKNDVLSDIETVYDLHKILPENVAQLESPVMAVLFEKVMTFF